MRLARLKEGQRFLLDGVFYRKVGYDLDDPQYVKCFDESSQEIADIQGHIPVDPITQTPDVEITLFEPDDTLTLSLLPDGSIFTMERGTSDLLVKVAECPQGVHVLRLQDMTPSVYVDCPVYWPNVTGINLEITVDE